jgi:hypothetical protein
MIASRPQKFGGQSITISKKLFDEVGGKWKE